MYVARTWSPISRFMYCWWMAGSKPWGWSWRWRATKTEHEALERQLVRPCCDKLVGVTLSNTPTEGRNKEIALEKTVLSDILQRGSLNLVLCVEWHQRSNLRVRSECAAACLHEPHVRHARACTTYLCYRLASYDLIACAMRAHNTRTIRHYTKERVNLKIVLVI